jgi:phosphate-selective porin
MFRPIASLLVAGAVGMATGSSVAAQTPSQPDDTQVDASRGGVTISSGVNSLTIGARAQFRWTVESREGFDGDEAGEGVGHEDGPQSEFDVPRLRVSLSGGAFRPWLRYLFQFDFSRTGGAEDSKIKDAILEIRPVGRSYRIMVGQFKAPFGLQQITSSGRLQFVDRAITDAKFSPGREMGAMFGGTTLSRKVGYEFGVFNGSGESTPQNNQSHLWAGRVFFEPWGPYLPAEGSSDAGEGAILHVGAGVRGGKQIRGRTAPLVTESVDNQSAWNVELVYKHPRFYSTAEYFWMTDEQENPNPGPNLDSRGFHLQASYMALPKVVEAGILWAEIRGDTDIDDAQVNELRGVLNYYFQAHNLKLQADIGRLAYGGNFSSLSVRARLGLPLPGDRLVSNEALSDVQLRVQLQLAF